MMHTSTLLFLSNLFSSDGILIIIVALLVFGGEKLPELARGLGKGIREFKDASDGVKREINNQIYNFEEKKQEDKRIEDAIKAQQEPPQNDGVANTVEIKPPAENTIPFNENGHVEPADHNGENHVEGNNELVADHHGPTSNTGPEKPVV